MNDLPDEIALIYAAAQTQQQQAQETLDRPHQHAQQLDALVRDTLGEPQLCIRVNTAAGAFGITHDYYLVHAE